MYMPCRPRTALPAIPEGQKKITTVRSSVGTPKIRRASIPRTMITCRKCRTFLCGNSWATKKGPRFKN